jgi:Ca2+ transporting ATPase
MFDNPLFYGILFSTAFLQVLIVQYGSLAFHVAEGGLEGKWWGLSLALGVGVFPVQQVINVAYTLGQKYKGLRMKKRLTRGGHLTTQRFDYKDERQESDRHLVKKAHAE